MRRLLSRRAWGLAALTVSCAIVAMPTTVFANEVRLPLPSGSIQEFALPFFPGEIAMGQEKSFWLTGTGEIARVTTKGVVTGEFAITTGSQSDTPFEYSDPMAIALGSDGNMWFTDGGANLEHENLVGRITPAGKIAEFPFATEGVEGPGTPGSIARGVDGDMWFTDVIYHTRYDAYGFIGRVDPDGAVTTFAVPTGAADDLPEQSIPDDIALGSDGDMWFTDRGRNDTGQSLIGRITPAGEITEFPIPELVEEYPDRRDYGEPNYIVQGSDGDMWFTLGVGVIGHITPEGSVTEYNIGAKSTGAIALGSDGDIWLADSENELVRVDPSGSATIFSPASISYPYIQSLIQGPEGDLWYAALNTSSSQAALVHLTIPFAPLATVAPSISGQAVEGDVLSVANGSWLYEPSTFAYQWQQCNAAGLECQDLAGLTDSSTTLQGLVGHTLRATVTATGSGGSTTASSPVSAVVQALPAAPTPPAQNARVGVAADKTLPIVSASMTWRFSWARSYTAVKALVVHGVPQGGWVEVVCAGRGCPFAHKRLGAPKVVLPAKCHSYRCSAVRPSRTFELELAKLFRRPLAVGARVAVDIQKAGWTGKAYTFFVRAAKVPRVETGCLAAGSDDVVNGC
jgi:virginiamycin B lyase